VATILKIFLDLITVHDKLTIGYRFST